MRLTLTAGLLIAIPENDVSNAGLYLPFQWSIINNHSQANWAVTEGI